MIMTEDQVIKYNEHALFLADIAKAVLEGNGNVLEVNGVKEIIALYLMIPYMSSSTLDTPDERCIIPKIQGKFCNSITYEDLRNTIAHSFVTVEEDKNDGSYHGKYLIFDDRIVSDKKEHSKKGNHSTAHFIRIDVIRDELLEQLQRMYSGN